MELGGARQIQERAAGLSNGVAAGCRSTCWLSANSAAGPDMGFPAGARLRRKGEPGRSDGRHCSQGSVSPQDPFSRA